MKLILANATIEVSKYLEGQILQLLVATPPVAKEPKARKAKRQNVRYTQEEDAIIISETLAGNKPTVIAQQLNGRTAQAIQVRVHGMRKTGQLPSKVAA